MANESYTLLSNASATGTAVEIPRGRYCFEVDGTFDGTVTLQKLGPDGSSYISVGADAELTAEGAVLVDLPATTVRAHVGSGSPSALYATLSLVGL